MRKRLVAGNWKMNLNTAGAGALVEQFIKEVQLHPDVDVVVCPPYLSIPSICQLVNRTELKVGAQDVFWEEKGAFTGQVSASQLADFHLGFCLVGHSEKRGRFGKLETPESTVGYFAETDETVNLKIKSLLSYGIAPILCVGETLQERQDGKTDLMIRSQLRGALVGFDEVELQELVVAYEPVWAIGTGEVCDTAEAERICSMIREHLSSSFSPRLGETVRVLYGGSVKADNAFDLFSQPNIDGGLVGGASLDPTSFASIVHSSG